MRWEVFWGRGEQGVGGGGRNQMVVLHNPAPRGGFSVTLLLRQDSRAAGAQGCERCLVSSFMQVNLSSFF